MSYLYKATKAYQEQLLCNAGSGGAASEVEPRGHRVDTVDLLKALRVLRQTKEAREGQSAPPACMQN